MHPRVYAPAALCCVADTAAAFWKRREIIVRRNENRTTCRGEDCDEPFARKTFMVTDQEEGMAQQQTNDAAMSAQPSEDLEQRKDKGKEK